MKPNPTIFLCVIIFCLSSAICFAANESQTHLLTNFYLDSNLGIRTLTNQSTAAIAAGENLAPQKSPNEAFLYSLVIPGMGQLYTGAKHGYIYTAAEVGLLATYFILRNSAVNTRDDYRDVVRECYFYRTRIFIDWNDEDFEHAAQYETWDNDYSGEDNAAGRETLDRTGYWYWMDMNPDYKNTNHRDIPIGSGSRNYRSKASDLREKANDTFQSARTVLGMVILNHVFSAVEARISTKRWNQKHKESGSIQIDLQTDISAGALRGVLVLRKNF